MWIRRHPVEAHLRLTSQRVNESATSKIRSGSQWHKMMFDVTDVMLCKHSETSVLFSCLGILECSEIVRIKKGYVLEGTGDRR